MSTNNADMHYLEWPVKHWWEGEYGVVTESDYDHLLALTLHL
jgi:hypothetical protein